MADKVLIVDDEPDILNLAKMILESKGYHVIAASNGDEAFSKASSERPDLILLDVMMPVKGGFDVCRDLKKQKKTQLIPIVMFTVLGRDVDKKMSRLYGANGYISKPFTYESLIGEVEMHLNAIRPYKFSGPLGLTHDKIRSRKILFKFDPTTPYERCVRDFALEAHAYSEAVVIVTPSGSAIQRSVEGDFRVEFIPITDMVHRQKILEIHTNKPCAIVYDNLTDLILSFGFQDAYTFTKNMLKRLAKKRVTSLFLLNQDINIPSEREISSLNSLFTDQIVFGIDGLTGLSSVAAGITVGR